MNTPDGSIPFGERQEFVEFVAQKVGIYLREKLTDFPGLRETVHLEVYRHEVIDGMIAEIRGWLVGGRVPGDSVSDTVRWPDGVWQMFKWKFFPEWFKRKFPVRYHEETFKIVTNHYFVCPHLVTDPHGMHIKFMATGTKLASMMSGMYK